MSRCLAPLGTRNATELNREAVTRQKFEMRSSVARKIRQQMTCSDLVDRSWLDHQSREVGVLDVEMCPRSNGISDPP